MCNKNHKMYMYIPLKNNIRIKRYQNIDLKYILKDKFVPCQVKLAFKQKEV